MTNTTVKLAVTEWVKIAGYAMAILGILFGYKAATRPDGPMNVTMQVQPLQRPVKIVPQEIVQLHQELDALKKQVVDLTLAKECLQNEVYDLENPDESQIEHKHEESQVIKKDIPQPDTSVVDWQYNESEAKTLAKKLNRPVYIYCTTNGCMFCEQVKLNCFQNPKVWNELKTHYVPLWAHTDNAQATIDEYGVRKFPRAVIVYPDGRSPRIFMPSSNPTQFLNEIK